MGRLSVDILKFLSKEDFRVLTAVEMGMKNHELVPGCLVARVANIRSGSIFKILKSLCEHRLCCYERGKQYDGYRLTNLGYDYLALKVLLSRDHIYGLGSQIGVGKESDIYLVNNSSDEILCMKLHRLGRNSFRKLKEKRDYHCHRHKTSWIYLSRLSAAKEFTFMQALHRYGFPVPRPVAHNRHVIIMSLVDGYTLNQVHEVGDVGQLYSDLMDLIVRLADHGVIHSDFNEFNIMLDKDTAKPVLIDFPQMISTSHENAEWYFDRDVKCVRDFCRRKFGFESEEFPAFKRDIRKQFNIDQEVMASGYSKDIKNFDAEFNVGEKDFEEEEKEEEFEGEEEEAAPEFDERDELEYTDAISDVETFDDQECEEKNSDYEDESKLLDMQKEMENLGLKDLETEYKPLRELSKRDIRKTFKKDMHKNSDAKSCKSSISTMSQADKNRLRTAIIECGKEFTLAKDRGEDTTLSFNETLDQNLKDFTFEDGTSLKYKGPFEDRELLRKKIDKEYKMKERKENGKIDKIFKQMKGKQVASKRIKKENIATIKECTDWDY